MENYRFDIICRYGRKGLELLRDAQSETLIRETTTATARTTIKLHSLLVKNCMKVQMSGGACHLPSPRWTGISIE